VERVEENAAAAGVELTAADVAALDALGPKVAGDRYTEGGMRAVNR
jgi:diketogulonate reductase-like aldo/keto reductase